MPRVSTGSIPATARSDSQLVVGSPRVRRDRHLHGRSCRHQSFLGYGNPVKGGGRQPGFRRSRDDARRRASRPAQPGEPCPVAFSLKARAAARHSAGNPPRCRRMVRRWAERGRRRRRSRPHWFLKCATSIRGTSRSTRLRQAMGTHAAEGAVPLRGPRPGCDGRPEGITDVSAHRRRRRAGSDATDLLSMWESSPFADPDLGALALDGRRRASISVHGTGTASLGDQLFGARQSWPRFRSRQPRDAGRADSPGPGTLGGLFAGLHRPSSARATTRSR